MIFKQREESLLFNKRKWAVSSGSVVSWDSESSRYSTASTLFLLILHHGIELSELRIPALLCSLLLQINCELGPLLSLPSDCRLGGSQKMLRRLSDSPILPLLVDLSS